MSGEEEQHNMNQGVSGEEEQHNMNQGMLE